MLNRNEILSIYKWDLTALISDKAEFFKKTEIINDRLKRIYDFKDKLTKENVLQCLYFDSEISLNLEIMYVFSHMKLDENTADTESLSRMQTVENLQVECSKVTSFIVPEISLFSDEDLNFLINNKEAEVFNEFFKAVLREKSHILSSEQEKMLSEIGAFSSDFKAIFSMLDNADLKFDPIVYQGEKTDMSHGMYSFFLQSDDREVRRQAYESNYKSYKGMINTISTIYYGNIKKNVATMRIRNYNSCLEKAMFGENVEPKVYENLIQSVHKNLEFMHDYVALRKKALGYDVMYFYDMYVSLCKDFKLEMDYEKAYELVIDALKPLGDVYKKLMISAKKEGWIDVYETENKRSGAYSWGAYGSHPFVLLNYQKTTHDIFTIAHEMGHAIHTYFSNSYQPFEKAGYTIFVAEVASTVNEVFLLKYLLKTAKGEERKFLLQYYLDMFRTTLFRQTMFAEFEKYAHELVENNQSVTHDTLSEFYLSLNKKYYGNAVNSDDDNIKVEWARIPHFYNAFYVYKYATGLTSAVCIVNKILNDENTLEKYFKFLQSGSANDPVSLLKMVDVDLTTSEPFDIAMAEFKNTIKDLAELI